MKTQKILFFDSMLSKYNFWKNNCSKSKSSTSNRKTSSSFSSNRALSCINPWTEARVTGATNRPLRHRQRHPEQASRARKEVHKKAVFNRLDHPQWLVTRAATMSLTSPTVGSWLTYPMRDTWQSQRLWLPGLERPSQKTIQSSRLLLIRNRKKSLRGS